MNVDVLLLSVKMSSKLQQKKESTEIKVDKSIQKECWERNDSCKQSIIVLLHFATSYHSSIFLYQDTTFEFEKRRNRPVRYNRELMGLTLKVMKRVSDIKHKRQDLFFKNRMRAHKVMQRERIRAHITKGIEILAPAAADRERILATVTSKIAAKNKVVEPKMEAEN